MEGWIKIWRKLGDSKLWLSEPFTRGQAWVDLLILANHSDGYLRKRGIRVEVCRGQVGWSEEKLAERWKWSRGKVRRFMSELSSEKEQKTVQQKSNITTLNTILNYAQYQGSGTTDGHQTVQQTDTKQYSNKNGKKEKNDKKELELPDFINPEIWKAFKEHRKKMRLIMTPHAEKLIINKLIKFQEDGVDPNAALDEAIEKSWRSVFAPKGEGPSEADQIRNM